MNAQPNPDPKQGMEQAIGRWQAELPADVVCLDEAVLDHRGRTTYEPTQAVSTVLQPTHKESFLNLGVVYIQSNEFAKAVTVLERALAIDPGYAKATELLRYARTKAGRP